MARAPQIYDTILEAIGNTPLVRLHSISRGIQADLLAKVEFFNPGGSVKDRIAGAGLAIVAALKGYKTVFVMPDKMSQEKVQLLRAYGAKVVITPTAVEADDPRSYYSVARKLVEETPNSILANQYYNPENPRSHYLTTGPEIWEQTEGKINVFVVGMGTGGTITLLGLIRSAQFCTTCTGGSRMLPPSPIRSKALARIFCPAPLIYRWLTRSFR
jgi:cystathionine beta-synthase